ncbi:hypothetical protein [Sporisorium scitamineum]|uniref:Uncharacterized protein n=2 Tax=Sporisorium scitamineum TaxID=49012 RepID=A0A0F7SC03_9BASI|nr:hypothetical protein [Sporisorium scitamineum]
MGAFPQYLREDFHFATESYGGHYGPVFNKYIQEQNAHAVGDANSTLPAQWKTFSYIRLELYWGTSVDSALIGQSNVPFLFSLLPPDQEVPMHVNYAKFHHPFNITTIPE